MSEAEIAALKTEMEKLRTDLVEAREQPAARVLRAFTQNPSFHSIRPSGVVFSSRGNISSCGHYSRRHKTRLSMYEPRQGGTRVR